MGQAKGGTGTGMMGGWGLETRLLHIHVGKHGLTGASYITTGSIAYLSHNSVCNNHFMSICIDYEPIMSPRMPQVI